MLNFTVPGLNTEQRIRFHTDQFSDPFHSLCSDGVFINIRHSKLHELVILDGVLFVDLYITVHNVNNNSKRLCPLPSRRLSQVQRHRVYSRRNIQ